MRLTWQLSTCTAQLQDFKLHATSFQLETSLWAWAGNKSSSLHANEMSKSWWISSFHIRLYMRFLLIKTEKSLLLGFQILLVKIHLNRAQCLWDANSTEKAVTHDGGMLKNSAFLQLARTQSGNVQKAIADGETLWTLSWRTTHSPSPWSCSAAMVRYGAPGAMENSPSPFKESRPCWFQNLLHSTPVSWWSLWISNVPKLNASPVTFHPKELQALFWDTTPPIPAESCLSHVCAAKGNSLRHRAQVKVAGSHLCCLELNLSVLNLSKSELHESTTELESELSAKQHQQ